MARRAVAIGAGLALVAAFLLVQLVDDGCPEPFVRYDADCVTPNELTVLTNAGQDRADLENAIAPFGGRIVFAVELAGVYTVRYPVTDPDQLVPLKQELESKGFSAAFSRMGTNFT